MRLEQLRSFEMVARVGNITRAADALFLSQPSLSRQLASLEHDLGVELLQRGQRGTTVTPAGAALLPVARRMLADAEAARREMAAFAGLERGRLRIGATPTLCVSLVAEALATFHRDFPGVELQVTESGSPGLVEALEEGALDLALVVSTGDGALRQPSVRIPLLTEQLVVVGAAQGSPLQTRSKLSVAELASLPQIAFHSGYELRQVTDAAFAQAHVDPRIVVEGAEMDAVLRFVECGIGVAVVPAMVLLDRPSLRAVPLTGERVNRTVSLAYRGDIRPTDAVAAMRTVLFDTVDLLTAPGTALARLVVRESGLPTPVGH